MRDHRFRAVPLPVLQEGRLLLRPVLVHEARTALDEGRGKAVVFEKFQGERLRLVESLESEDPTLAAIVRGAKRGDFHVEFLHAGQDDAHGVRGLLRLRVRRGLDRLAHGPRGVSVQDHTHDAHRPDFPHVSPSERPGMAVRSAASVEERFESGERVSPAQAASAALNCIRRAALRVTSSHFTIGVRAPFLRQAARRLVLPQAAPPPVPPEPPAVPPPVLPAEDPQAPRGRTARAPGSQ